MKTNLLLLLTLVALPPIASAGAPAKVNKGVIHARTFNFVKPSSKPEPGFVANTEDGHATRPILQNLSAGTKAARIQEVVDEILRDVRIEP